MSEKVMESVRELNTLIKESEEYQKYCLYKEELEQFPELYYKVQEFRKKNFMLQLEADTENQNAMVELAAEYRQVLENPIAASYLNAELAFCKMAQNVSKVLYSDIDIELDFL